MAEYVAFDFETANYQAHSACSLGAVKVVDGKMVQSFYSLIDPRTNFAKRNIEIHGITASQVIEQPTYDYVINQFREFAEGLPVVSHTQFDRGVIQAANAKYGIHGLDLDYFDSCQLARKIWKGKVARFGLKPLSQQIKFEFSHHHALEDARAAAYIIHALLMFTKTHQIEDLLKAAKVKGFYYL